MSGMEKGIPGLDAPAKPVPKKQPAKKKPTPAKAKYRIVHGGDYEHFRPIELGEMTLEQARDRLDEEEGLFTAQHHSSGLILEKLVPVPLTAEQIEIRQWRQDMDDRRKAADQLALDKLNQRREEWKEKDMKNRATRDAQATTT